MAFWIPTRIIEDTIKWKKKGMSFLGSIQLLQSRGMVQCRIVVTKIMKIRSSQYVKYFVETLANNSVS